MELPPPCPWSKNQLRRLGKKIRDGLDAGNDSPTYDEVLAWYDELAENPEERELVEFVQQYSLETIARLERRTSRLITATDHGGVERDDPSWQAHSAEVVALEADLLGIVQRIEDSLR